MTTTTLYNPAALSAEDLISNFVVRSRTFNQVFRDIEESDMRYPEKHYLMQGERGMGKTMLLLRLKYEIERNVELKDWLIPLFFGEEAYDVSSLSGLWEKILKYLDEYFETGGKYYEYTDRFLNLEDYEKRCFDYLIQILSERGIKLVILYDNFGTLFLDNLREKEKRRLREILIECNYIRIIGSSAVAINDLHDYSQPFFEFFKIIYLEELNQEETYTLLTKLQENRDETKRLNLHECKAKIDTLIALSGGVIRTIMIIYRVLLDDQKRTVLQDLQKVLDEVTPAYKHGIEDLPVQQRRIVDVIAKKWDAVSTKEIAGELREGGRRMSTKQISAQLNQLEKNNVVEKKATNTKNNLYQLRERFFNIWYLMRNGDRGDKKRVEWLINFLEIWYGEKEGMTVPITNPINLLKEDRALPPSVFLTAAAFAGKSGRIDSSKVTRNKEGSLAILQESEPNYLPTITYRKLTIAYRYFENGEVPEAVEIVKNVKEPNRSCYLLLAYLYLESGERINAKKELYKVAHLQPVEFDFFVNLCLRLETFDYLEKELVSNRYISQGQKEKALADAYMVKKEYPSAILHYRKALLQGMEVSEGYIASLKKGDAKRVEEVLMNEYGNGVFPANHLLEFLLMEQKPSKRTIEKAYSILSSTIKDADYYLFYGLTLTYDVNKTKEVEREIIRSYRKSMLLYDQNGQGFSKYLLVASLLLTRYIHDFNKKKALDLVADIKAKDLDKLSLTLAPCLFVDLWNNDFSTIKERMESLINLESERRTELGIIKVRDILILLLAKKQYHTVLEVFEMHETLSSVMKPVYYAVMTILKEERPNEVIRMGEELKGPVEEILTRVKQQEVNYW